MLSGSSVVVFVLGMAAMLGLLYFSMTYSPEPNIPRPRITEEEALQIADSDLKHQLSDYNGIVGIIDTSWSRYVPLDEFEDTHLHVPLIYIPVNGSLLLVGDRGVYENRGACNNSSFAYCGWYGDYYNFDYGSRLVYGVEMEVRSQEALAMYIIDATDGKIVDSTFMRMDWVHAHTNEES